MYEFMQSLIKCLFIILNVIIICLALLDLITTKDYLLDIPIITLCMLFVFHSEIEEYLETLIK